MAAAVDPPLPPVPPVSPTIAPPLPPNSDATDSAAPAVDPDLNNSNHGKLHSHNHEKDTNSEISVDSMLEGEAGFVSVSSRNSTICSQPSPVASQSNTATTITGTVGTVAVDSKQSGSADASVEKSDDKQITIRPFQKFEIDCV